MSSDNCSNANARITNATVWLPVLPPMLATIGIRVASDTSSWMVDSKRPMKRVAANAVTRLTNSQRDRLRADSHTGREHVFGAAKARHRQRFFVRRHPDEIDDRIDGQPSHELAAIVHHRQRHEIVPLERARGVCRQIGRAKRQRVALHHGVNRRIGVC